MTVVNEKTCEICGATFRRRAKLGTRRFLQQRTCSHKCRGRDNFIRFNAIAKAGEVYHARRLADPAFAAAHNARASAVIRHAQAMSVEKALSWCPPAYRAAYRQLVRQTALPAAEARAIIQEQIATDARRQIRDITAQMDAKAAREKAMAY